MIEWIVIIIAVLIFGFYLFFHIVGWMVDEGFKARDDCYYDPDKNNWYPFVSLTEEQRSRIVSMSPYQMMIFAKSYPHLAMRV